MSGFLMIVLALLALVCFLASGLSLAMQSRAALRKENERLKALLQKEHTPVV